DYYCTTWHSSACWVF
nr:immunoglobulin light chain junction region [Macaca mulatta]